MYSLWGHKESDTTERLSLHFIRSQHSPLAWYSEISCTSQNISQSVFSVQSGGKILDVRRVLYLDLDNWNPQKDLIEQINQLPGISNYKAIVKGTHYKNSNNNF